MGSQRIYIGGLTPDVTDTDVLGRFKPFGQVASCEIVRGKCHSGDPADCRGFAYVTFIPKDEAALAKVFSLYNGCKWRGQRLRVELANPHYSLKLQQEWQEEQQHEQAAQEQQKPLVHAASTASDAANGNADDEPTAVRITIPGTRKSVSVDLTSKAESYRNWFAAQKEKRISELDWEPLRPSKRVALQAAADAAAYKPPPLAAAAGPNSSQQHHQQQQRHQAALAAGGAAVPYHYKEQQQQTTKGKQLDQEHFSQLKLLKKIAEQEQAAQKQQQHYDTVASRAGDRKPTSKAETELAKHQQQQQQQRQRQEGDAEPSGTVVFSDDYDDVAGLVPTAAVVGGAGQLSRFADDSDDEEAPSAAEAPANNHEQKRQQGRQQGGVDRDRAAAAVIAPAAAASGKQSEQSKKCPVRCSTVSTKSAAPVATASGSVNGSNVGSTQALRDVDLENRNVGAATLAGVEQQHHQQQQGKGAQLKGSLAQDQGQQLPKNAAVQHQKQQQQPGQQPKVKQQQAVVDPMQLHEPTRAAAAPAAELYARFDVESEEVVNQSTSREPDQEEASQSLLLQQHQQQTLRQVQPQESCRVLQQQQQQQPAVIHFLDADDPDAAAAAAIALDDRFSSDSEEVLRDVDSEDEAVVHRSHTKQQQQQSRPGAGRYQYRPGGRELLCPLVPRAGSGKAAAAKVAPGGLQRAKLAQQQSRRIGSR